MLTAFQNAWPSTPQKEAAAVSYGKPYKVENNCLCVEHNSGRGRNIRKLCNFMPWLISETTVHDGIEDVKKLLIGGRHENGIILPEICIPASEFASINWVTKYWGARCNLEPGQTVKDSIRHAIQQTAPNMASTEVYTHTGWIQKEGDWHYLFCGHPKYDVELQGKMTGYSLKKDYTKMDLQDACALLENGLAPKHILYPLLSLVFLSPLNEFLKQANCEPKAILALTGKTGTRKSTLAALMISFFGNFTNTSLPLSFHDTAKSIQYHLFSLKDVLTVIDDFHPGSHPDEQEMTKTAQMLMRGFGDRVGRNKLRSDSSPMESRPPRGNAIITAEYAPDITESGTARYLNVEIKESDLDLGLLTQYQGKAAQGVLSGTMYAYVEWIKKAFLTDEDNILGFVAALEKSFIRLRDDFVQSIANENIHCHPRVPEAIAWLYIGFDMMCWFYKYAGVLGEEKSEYVLSELRKILIELAKMQADSIARDRPTAVFLQKFFSLIDSGQAVLLNKNEPCRFPPNSLIGYQDDSFYYLYTDVTHRMVRQLCEQQGESFPVSSKALLHQLADEKLIEIAENGNRTKMLRLGGRTIRVMFLIKSKANVAAGRGT